MLDYGFASEPRICFRALGARLGKAAGVIAHAAATGVLGGADEEEAHGNRPLRPETRPTH